MRRIAPSGAGGLSRSAARARALGAPRRPAPWLTCLALLAATAARADCYGDLLGSESPYGEQIYRDPAAAVTTLEALRAAPAGKPGAPDPALLQAMLADAYYTVGHLEAAREAAAQGIAVLAPTDSAGLRRWLQFKGILLRAEQGELSTAMEEFEVASTALPEDAPEFACVLIDRGYLRYRMGRMSESASDLIRAYQLTADRHSEVNHMLAASLLALLYSKNGFREEARDYASEIIDFDQRSGNRRWLADGYFRRGDVSLGLGDYGAAESDFRQAIALWQQIGFPMDVEAGEHRLCATLARMPGRSDAAAVCEDARRRAVELKDPETSKTVTGLLGQIAFRDHHPRVALTLLDQALSADGVDINRATDAEFHGLRAQVRAELGDAPGALADTTQYLHWLQSNVLARNVGQIAVTRAKFEAAVQEQQLGRLRAEAANAQLAASRQRLQTRLTVLSLALLFSTALFGLWVYRRRQETERVARAAQERLAAMGQVTGGIAHDFNNQLTVLQQAAWLLSRRPSISADPAASELLQGIRQSGESCAGITAQMLSFARQQNLKPEPIGLAGFLAEQRAALEAIAGASITLRLEIETPEPVALVDRRQLAAALLNLISNARDATAGTGVVLVQARRRDPQRVQLSVIDHGCGMDPPVLARAIEPFYTTKPVGRGSGLGLSMVQGFATQSGGALTLHSEVDRGTSVVLTLPSAPPAP